MFKKNLNHTVPPKDLHYHKLKIEYVTKSLKEGGGGLCAENQKAHNSKCSELKT